MADEDDEQQPEQYGSDLFTLPGETAAGSLAALLSPLNAQQLVGPPPGDGSASDVDAGDVAESTPLSGNLAPKAPPAMPANMDQADSVPPLIRRPAEATGADSGLASLGIPASQARSVSLAPQPKSGGEALAALGDAPSYDTAKVTQMQAQRDKDATKLNINDPDHPEYRPGVGTKILRGLAGYFGNGGIAGVFNADYNAPTAAYRQADAQRQGQLSKDQQALQDYSDMFGQQTKAYDTGLAGVKEAIGLQKNDDLATARQENADTKAQLAKAQEALDQATAAAKDPAAAMRARAGQMAQFGQGLTPSQRSEAILTGKITRAPSIRLPSEGEQEFHDWKGAFQQQNKRPPNADEIQAYRSKAGGRSAGGGDPTDKDIATLVAYRKQIADELPRADDTDIPDLKQKLKDVDGRIAAAAEAQDRARGQQDQGNPKTHVFNPGAWQAANPKGDVQAAIRAAQARGFTVSQ